MELKLAIYVRVTISLLFSQEGNISTISFKTTSNNFYKCRFKISSGGNQPLLTLLTGF